MLLANFLIQSAGHSAAYNRCQDIVCVTFVRTEAEPAPCHLQMRLFYLLKRMVKLGAVSNGRLSFCRSGVLAAVTFEITLDKLVQLVKIEFTADGNNG